MINNLTENEKDRLLSIAKDLRFVHTAIKHLPFGVQKCPQAEKRHF